MSKFKIGIIQMIVKKEKEINLNNARNLVNKLASLGANIIVLPEMFSCPYDNSYFPTYAEYDYEHTYNFLSNLAKVNNIYLVAGSVPEKHNNNIYNTSYVFDRNGNNIAKHRKIHLFDINIKNRQKFKESDTLSPGNNITVFDTEFGKIGLCICYDFRFPELARLMVNKGAQAIIVPASFNMTTGPAHWDIMFKSRAIDNQVYTIGCSPARDSTSTYVSYGHSLVISPFGETICELDEKEACITCEIDLDYVDKIRDELPLLMHRRIDLYNLIEK